MPILCWIGASRPRISRQRVFDVLYRVILTGMRVHANLGCSWKIEDNGALRLGNHAAGNLESEGAALSRGVQSPPVADPSAVLGRGDGRRPPNARRILFDTSRYYSRIHRRRERPGCGARRISTDTRARTTVTPPLVCQTAACQSSFLSVTQRVTGTCALLTTAASQAMFSLPVARCSGTIQIETSSRRGL